MFEKFPKFLICDLIGIILIFLKVKIFAIPKTSKAVLCFWNLSRFHHNKSFTALFSNQSVTRV